VSGPSATCPGCGASVQFRWSSAVQSVCPYCRSILVRQDLDLRKVGTVADLPASSSPIQLGTAGSYRRRPFEVVGRILYEYDAGTWNEWHIAFDAASSGWLSDAQAEYAVTFPAPAALVRPPRDQVEPGRRFTWQDKNYEVTTLTTARYRGVEGDLPFTTWDREEAVFADLKSGDASCATLDYSEEPPLLFLGEYMAYGDLGLTNVRRFDGW
jgi:uncharacterized protein DUF4178